jgi:hypothetical protein
VPHPRLRKAALLACALLLLAAGIAQAGAVIESGPVALRLNAQFQPRLLPKHSFAPVEFEGRADIGGRGAPVPPALERIVVDFDRDGRLSVAGLPTCAPETVISATVAEARRLCRGAIVGSGEIEADVALPTGVVVARSPLTIFNGPPLAGHPTAVIHARTSVPSTQTYAIVVPIEKRRGEFRYQATVDNPPLAAGLGALTHIDVKIGRRYSAGGHRRSYVSARCSDGILRSHAIFDFAGGFEIEGTGLEKFCRAR